MRRCLIVPFLLLLAGVNAEARDRSKYEIESLRQRCEKYDVKLTKENNTSGNRANVGCVEHGAPSKAMSKCDIQECAPQKCGALDSVYKFCCFTITRDCEM